MAVLPAQVVIGYRPYRIEEWSAAAASGAGKFGEVCHTSFLIKIRSDVDAIEIANTLLHEILHCCWRNGVLDEKDDEERVVLVLANQLLQVWRDNPAVVAFMTGAMQPKKLKV